MLTLKFMMEMWEKCHGARLNVALDKLDNSDHRTYYKGPALPVNYVPKPGERTVRVCLDY